MTNPRKKYHAQHGDGEDTTQDNNRSEKKRHKLLENEKKRITPNGIRLKQKIQSEREKLRRGGDD